jgi:hypothetical protein
MVSVLNIAGREYKMHHFLKHGSVLEATIDVEDLRAGLYLLRIQQGAEVMVRRWVKK